jgi:hypothetical protein
MAASETPSLVFLRVSFTMRERFTPARACSTLTRMRASFRFVRFSASVSSPRGGFFFRLPSFSDCWLVSLETGILVQHRSRRVGNALLVSDLLVVGLADIGLAQEADPLPTHTGDHDVLVAVGLLLTAVVQGLFFRAFRPLAATLRAIDDQLRIPCCIGLALSKVSRVSLREDAQIREGILQDGQQPVNPVVHRRLTQTEEFGHDDLQGVGLEVDEDEQQFLFRAMQSPLTSPTSGALPGFASHCTVRGVERLVGPCEGGQEQVKLRKGQPCEGQVGAHPGNR